MPRATNSKTRHSRDEWMRLMDEHKASGLTQREFCQRRQLAYSTFGYWRKQLRQAAATDAVSEPLVELPVLAMPGPSAWRVELDLGQGVILRVR